jgi:cyclic pyranopterin phosphate synthase
MTRGGDLSQVLNGVEAAVSSGLTPVKINCVVIGGFNDDELPQFADLTRRPGISVRFIELMPFGECSEWSPASFVALKNLEKEFGVLENASEVGGGPARVYRIPGAAGTVGFISGTSEHFCHECNRLRITSAGHARPCLFAEDEFDLLPAVRERSMSEVQQIMLYSLGHKPDRLPVLKGKRMAEIGG